MTNINPSSENSNPSSDRKHNYPLRSGITEILLSPNNIKSSPKTMKCEKSDKDPMKHITDEHLDALNSYQKEVGRKVKEDDSERRDQMKDLDYHKLVVNQRVANNKIYDTKKEQENLKKDIPMYENDFLDGNIGPDAFESCMEKNRERYVKNRDEIKELQKKIIKIDLGVQEIKDQLNKDLMKKIADDQLDALNA